MDYYDDNESGGGQLARCDICDRNFTREALSRHRPICQNSAQKKRKIFDSSKQRAQGTEIIQFQKKNVAARKRPEPVPKKSNWRQSHRDFINTIRAARGVQIAMERGEPLPPPPPPSYNPDYIQCDYCGRRFNESAAQRHITFCKEQHERLPAKKKPDYAAAQKQTTRLQYRPPKPKKAGAPGYQQQSQQLDYNDGGGNNTGYHSSGYSTSNQGYSSGSTRVTNSTPVRPNGGVSFKAAERSSRGTADYSRADRSPSGQALRTGRTAQTYSEARQLSAKQRAGMAPRKYPSNDNIHGSAYNSSQYTGTGFTPSGRGYTSGGSSGYGVSTRAGYGPSSSSSSANTPKGRGNGPAVRMSPGAINSFAGRFCYDCGAKFPSPQAKFCCECGTKKTVNA